MSKPKQTQTENHDTARVNREIKDGLFRTIFEVPENAAELYYALTGIKCDPEEIQIITLTTIISGAIKNDLAFVVRGKAMVIGEHMSGPYTNMATRILMYYGQLCEKWIKMKDEERFLYSSKLYKIPTPEFVVFYNGTEERPEKDVIRLSDAFEYEQDKSLGYLELEVPIYNINKGKNSDIFSKSPKLRHYSEFVAKIRELNKAYDDFAKAVREAVNYCIANDILADFLKEQGGKIVSILSAEYDLEAAKRYYAEDRVEEIAREMLLMGLSKEQVSRATKLSVEEIMRIESEL